MMINLPQDQTQLYVLQAILLEKYDRLGFLEPVLNKLVEEELIWRTPSGFALPDDVRLLIEGFRHATFQPTLLVSG